MSRSFFLLLLLLVSTVIMSAFLVEKWLSEPNTPTIELDQNQLTSLLSHCDDSKELCPLLTAHQIQTDKMHLSDELTQQISDKGMLLLSNDHHQMLLLKHQNQYFNISLPADLMAVETKNQNSTLAFYALNTLLLLIVIFPLFITLHKLSKQAQKVSKTGFPEPIALSYPSLLSPLINSFNSMVTKLHQTIDLQRELSATVCHEMHTLLSKIVFINAMIEDVPVNKTQQQLTKITDDMQQLVDEYLNFSKQEHQYAQIKLCSQNIHQLLQDSCERFQEHLVTKITLHCQPLHYAKYERRALSRAVNNLLSNAAKYSTSHICVSFQEDSSHYILTVEDDGTGFGDIPPTSQPFQQGQQALSGFGLGLAIVRRVMDWHQGQVVLSQSQHLGGAKVCMLWPKQVFLENK